MKKQGEIKSEGTGIELESDLGEVIAFEITPIGSEAGSDLILERRPSLPRSTGRTVFQTDTGFPDGRY